MTQELHVAELVGSVKRYAWGKNGAASLVNQIAGSMTGPDADKNGAEYWLGAHPAAACELDLGGGKKVVLQDYLKTHAHEILGTRVAARFGNNLPFLLKILSIGQPLSIQLHPSLAAAQRLHDSRPELFPDANHKPEVAFALSDFTLLWGSKDAAALKKRIAEVPELSGLLASASSTQLDQLQNAESVAALWKILFGAAPSVLREATRAVLERLGQKPIISTEDSWLLKLAEHYPDGDVGVFSAQLMQLLELRAGDAIFTGAGIPHAYLTGDLIECMASSDNVVRAGLTAKAVDVAAFMECADFSFLRPPIIKGSIAGRQVISAQAEEFSLERISKGQHVIGQPDLAASSVQILFNLNAAGTVSYSAKQVVLESKKAYLIPAQIGECRLSVTSGEIFRVWIP